MSLAAFINTTHSHNALTTPSGKSSVVEPKLCGRDREEQSNILTSEMETSLNEDIMQLARMGDIQGIEKIFRSRRFDSSYCDEEGITPLHWAAINNQYSMCEFLLKEGADVNKKGGESVATPAMWAAQRCHYYIVNLLLKHGADPLANDIQGYNILHLATFEGSILLLILLLHHGIDVDIPDRQGHTCLMWAAYKGFPSCVDLFLRWGANVHHTDETGLTALHWALVKGSQGCTQKLIEYGSDRFAPTLSGKTPATTAHEMKTVQVWQRALKEGGYDEEGNPINLRFPMSNILMKNKRVFMNRFFFVYPVLIIWTMIMIASHLVVFVGIPLSLLVGYGLQWVAQQMITYAPSDIKKVHMTPWLAGIFAGTLFLVGLNWLITLLPETFSTHTMSNILFGALYSLCAYFYSCTMIFEPGFVPKLGSILQQKEVIDELLSIWRYDESNFCVSCMVRQPLRSKHCKQCKRCVAKYDHHCPWVFNCIGVKNHRHFLLYLITLELGVMTLLKITIGYFEHRLSAGPNDSCYLLPSSLCQLVNADPYTLILVFWSLLQLTWVTMLIFVQLTQISRATTTWENMHGSYYDDPSKALEAIRNHHHDKKGCFALCKKVLGVDTFLETALTRKDVQQQRNPFSAGFLKNCQDFWCDPAPIFGNRKHRKSLLRGQVIDYTTMYEAPYILTTRRRGGNVSTYESVALDDTHE